MITARTSFVNLLEQRRAQLGQRADLALKRKAGVIVRELLDEGFMALPNKLVVLRNQTISAYELVRAREAQGVGNARGHEHLWVLAGLTGQLARTMREKEDYIAQIFRSVPLMAKPVDFMPWLVDLAKYNRFILTTRLEMLEAGLLFEHQVNGRLSSDGPDDRFRAVLAAGMRELYGRQRVLFGIKTPGGSGFISQSDADRLGLSILAVGQSKLN